MPPYDIFLSHASADKPAVERLAHKLKAAVSGSRDGMLRVWDVESGEVECLLTLDAPVNAVAVIPESRTIVAGDSSGRVHFFDFVEPPPRVETRGYEWPSRWDGDSPDRTCHASLSRRDSHS